MSLEGVLSGTALGVLLLFLIEDIAQAAFRTNQGAGPLEETGPTDLGEFLTNTGSIPIKPLQDLALGQGTAAGLDPSQGGDGLSQAGNNNNNLIPLQPSQNGREPLLNTGLQFDLRGSSSAISSATYQPNSNNEAINANSDPTPVGPKPIPKPDPNPNPQPDPSPAVEIPQGIFILVRTDPQVVANSLDQVANAQNDGKQRGIAFSTVGFKAAALPTNWTNDLHSERIFQTLANSLYNDASIDQNADHAASFDSIITSGNANDLITISANELLNLCLQSGAFASCNIVDTTSALDGSILNTKAGQDLVNLEALLGLKFMGLGNSNKADLNFDLATRGMKDSSAILGNGDDQITILSGFANQQSKADMAGLDFSLGNTPEASSWSFNLKAEAIGMDNSIINSGSGNDNISISTVIDTNIDEAIGPLLTASSTSINLERIGMVNSSIDMGDGDDTLVVNGRIIDSIIDMGSGNNTVRLDQPLEGSSQILSSGTTSIRIQNLEGGILSGTTGDDNITVSSLGLVGQINAGQGTDSLHIADNTSREIVRISSPNSGLINNIQFRDLEGLDLGGGNDVVLMEKPGGLTGQLIGGNGMDQLNFSSWTSTAEVDLDLGKASGIGSITGFEEIVGGEGNDKLYGSGLSNGIQGHGGDDLILLRWSPWLSDSSGGPYLAGNDGNDLFLFNNLEAIAPASWDGHSGLATLIDLDLSAAQNNHDRLGWISTDGILNIPTAKIGTAGIGDAALLPIAPLEQLLSGMHDGTKQLAIASDGSGPDPDILLLLGAHGIGTAQAIAQISGGTLPQPSSSN